MQGNGYDKDDAREGEHGNRFAGDTSQPSCDQRPDGKSTLEEQDIEAHHPSSQFVGDMRLDEGVFRVQESR